MVESNNITKSVNLIVCARRETLFNSRVYGSRGGIFLEDTIVFKQ